MTSGSAAREVRRGGWGASEGGDAHEWIVAGSPCCWGLSEKLCGTHLGGEESEGIYLMW